MENACYITGAEVLTQGRLARLDITVEDGRVVRLSSAHDNPGALPVIDAAGLRVLPGFIDVHTHGAAGVDVNAADVEGLRKIGRFFASQGVTGWLCSILTDTPEQTLWCIEQARQVIEGGSVRRCRPAGHPPRGSLPVERVQGCHARASAHA